MSSQSLSKQDLEDLEDSLEDLDRDELVDVVQDLLGTTRETMAHQDAMQNQINLLMEIVAGSRDRFFEMDPDVVDPLHDRLEDLADVVADHDDSLEMFVVEDGSRAKPDDRATHLRQVLLNDTKADGDGVASLTRDNARAALGGGLHKGVVLDAMRRAANGRDADIGGASQLQPVDAITFDRGGRVGSDGNPDQSVLVLRRDDLTGTEARQILTTGDGGEGG